MGGGSAYYVYPDGNVHFDSVTRDSCGRWMHRSPDTIGPSYAKDVTYTGEVMGNYANGSVGESYGIFDIDKIRLSLSGHQRQQRCEFCVLGW